MIVSYENSRILRILSSLRDWLFCTQMKFYGFLFLYFGLCVVLMNLVKRFAFPEDMSSALVWMVGAMSIAMAFPMLASGKSLARNIHESNVLSFLFEKALGCSVDEPLEQEDEVVKGRYFIASLVGALLGSLSYFVSPLYMILGACALIFAALVYRSPRTGVIISVFAAPLLAFLPSPSIILALLVLYTFLCTCIKIFLGKLSVKLEISDMFVAIFMVVMLMAGIVSAGGVSSLRSAAIYVCFMMIYFMIVWLVNTKGMLERIMAALVISGTLTSLYGLYQKFTGNMEIGTMDKDAFSGIEGRVTATFENSNMLGVFIIMVFPFALSYLFRAEKALSRIAALISCAGMGLCLIYTWSRGAWIGLIIACLLFVLLYNHYVLPILMPTALLGITLLWGKIGGSGLLTNLIGRFSSIVTMSDTSSVYRLGIWRGALKVAERYWFTGIGIGEAAFRSVYIRYAESGIETAVHSHNLFLQIFIETGAVGFAVFLVAIILCIKSGLELIKKSTGDTHAEKAVCVAAVSGLVAALVQGMTDNIWFNYRIFFMFWVTLAILSAASRMGRNRIRSKSEY